MMIAQANHWGLRRYKLACWYKPACWCHELPSSDWQAVPFQWLYWTWTLIEWTMQKRLLSRDLSVGSHSFCQCTELVAKLKPREDWRGVVLWFACLAVGCLLTLHLHGQKQLIVGVISKDLPFQQSVLFQQNASWYGGLRCITLCLTSCEQLI